MKKLTTIVWMAGLLAMFAGCSSDKKPPSVGAQLDQARVLNSELRAEWDTTRKMLASTLKAVEELPKLAIDPQKLEVNLLRKALFECFNSPVGAGADSARSGATVDGTPTAAAPPCEGTDVDALKNIGGAAGPEISDLYKAKLGSIALVKLNLRQQLPARTKEMSERYIRARKSIEEIEFAAQREKKSAETGDASDADKAKFRTDFDALNKEIDAVKALMDETEDAPSEIDNAVRTAIDELLSKLAAMGS